MKLSVQTISSFSSKETTLVFPIFEGVTLQRSGLRDLDMVFSGRLQELFREKVITGKKGTLHTCLGYGKTPMKRLVIIGLGKKDAKNVGALRDASGTVARYLKTVKEPVFTMMMPELLLKQADLCQLGQEIGEGLVMGGYQFRGYQKESEKETSIKGVVLKSLDREAKKPLLSGLEKGCKIGEAVNKARDLGNTPANFLNPIDIVSQSKDLVKAHKSLSLEVLDAKKAKKLGMNAFLGVAQGSAQDPYMVIIRYQGAKKSEAPVAWVGKGVTFDTGGISIKPSKGMREMKGDMGGAAAVFGAMQGLAVLKPECNVMGIMPLVENMPSSTAQKPGDVVIAMNGKSIEITNTDAEGRLILADALCYAVKQKPSHIVDLATLTGAALIAVGHEASVIMGNDQRLVDAYVKRSEMNREKLWQLPLYDAYLEYLKSDVADLINANENRLAGTCTAGKFLEQFVDETPWLHLDIAPTMSHDKTSGADVKGMSGAGVRTLLDSVCG
ncbi:leucyl aminopeptidase [Candidatus Marinamargulisbacteria bacterium SCGC AG-439-L15]|nr:leucyl aminopeptidase [Candidatus Marinamargulisbacteria bacterium SCGC AG-439-L15]